MAVSMEDVKNLREITKAGMMDCKNALEKANGNIDEALKILKEKGLADAKKRSDRETKEGGAYIKREGNKIAIALIGCETDFVANNDIFKASKDAILNKMIQTGDDNMASYKELLDDAISKIKENIEFKKAKFIEIKNEQFAATYIHGNNKIGVICIFNIKDQSIKNNDKFKEFANNICLHIAANSPFFLSSKDVPSNEIEEQKQIFIKQMENSGKPANIVENIVNGKLSKHFADICLLEQKYVKDDKVTIDNFIKNTAKDLNTEITIANFIRYQVGN